MTWRAFHAVLRSGFALLGLAAIVAQLLDLANTGVFDPVNFFSYFTIQSNLIAIAVLLWAAATWRDADNPRLDFVRGAATTYLTITFIVFALLLADTDVDTALVWVDRVLHRLLPMMLIVDWLIDPPSRPIEFRRALWWISYPLAWTAYVMVRGAISGKYPYPFLDPATQGYGSVLVYAVLIFIGTIGLIYAISWTGNRLQTRLDAG
jgi:hypothetical protein